MISIGISLFLLSVWLPIPPVYSYSILAITGCLLFFLPIEEGGKKRALISILVVTFALGSIATIFFSKDVARSIAASLHQGLGVLIFFLIAYGFKKEKDYLLTYAAISITACFISAYLLLVTISDPTRVPLEWVHSAALPLIAVPNDVAFCCLTAPLLLSICDFSEKRALHLIAVIQLMLLALTAAVYRSAVGLFCLVCALAVYALLTKNAKHLASLSIIILTAFLADFYFQLPLTKKFIETVKSGGWDPRIAIWLVAWGMFLKAPLTGLGPHTFINYYKSSLVKLDLPPELTVDTRVVPWAHNLYLEILAERGLLVFLVFFGLIMLTLFYSIRFIRNLRGGISYLASGALAALSAFMVGAFFEFTFLRLWVIIILYSLLGCIVGLWSYVPAESPETATADETQIPQDH